MSDNPRRHDGSNAAQPARPTGAPAPVQPSKPPAMPPPKKERPLAPLARDASADVSAPSGGLPGMHIVDDDDAVIIPDLDAERLVATPRYVTPQPRARDALRSLFFRRTMIPILLTCGLMLPTLAALWFLTDPNHVVRGTGLWLPVTFIVLGAVFLLLAVVNMAQVRHMLGKTPAPKQQ